MSSNVDEYNALVTLIKKSLAGDVDGRVHEQAIIKSHNYLLQYQSEGHWFCNDHLYPISIYSLILFSFPETTYKTDLLPHFTKSLTTCTNCLRSFNKGKAELRLSFAIQKKLPISNVQQFINAITQWEITNLAPLLDTTCQQFSDGDLIDEDQANIVIHWLLNNTDILIQNGHIKKQFDYIVSQLKLGIIRSKPKSLLPGLIYILFEGTADAKAWANQWINKLKQSQVLYDKVGLNESVILEFSKHLYRIQDAEYYNSRRAIRFWEVFNTIIDFIDDDAFVSRFNSPSDIEVMSKHNNLRFNSVTKVLANTLMSQVDEPLPILLKVFTKLLRKLQSTFWSLTIPTNHLEINHAIISNPAYHKLLEQGSMEEQSMYDWNLNDIIQWMFAIVKSVPVSQSQALSLKLFSFLIKFSSNDVRSLNDSRVHRERYLQGLGCKFLDIAFDFVDNGDVALDFVDNGNGSDSNFAVKLMALRDLRAKIEHVGDKLVSLAISNTGDESSTSSHALSVIIKCLKYDVALLSHNSILLLDFKTPVIYDTFPMLWAAVSKSKLNANIFMAKEIIKCFSGLVVAIRFYPTKNPDTNKQLMDSRLQHNENIDSIIKFVNSIFGNISLASSSSLNEIIKDTKCLESIWSCIFFPPTAQAALDILDGIFDGGGRFESIQECLNNNLNGTLRSINGRVTILTKLEAFEPTPRAVRILMDVVKALTDPLSSILSSSEVSKAYMEIQQFWSSCLSFLIMIYEKAMVWAGKYHMHELVEFTRDTLDLSHSLLESFRLIADGIAPYAGEDSSIRLFGVYMNAFKNILAWLKLGDTVLLNYCVDLVFKVIDLAVEQGFPIDDSVIETFAKFGVKAKRFNNKLSESQRSQILAKAREFNDALVESIVQANHDHKSRSKIELIEKYVSPEPPVVIPKSFYRPPQPATSHQKQQQTLGRFARTTSEPPVAPPQQKDAKGTNTIASLRQELQQSRQAVKTEKVPAPARPAGFNSKKTPPVIGRSLNSSAHKPKKTETDSSSEEDDSEVDELFGRTRKKVKITELDFNGKKISSINKPKALKPVDQEKLDRDRMRKRLNVNLNPLYQIVLKWNYNSNSEFPTKDRSAYENTKPTYKDVKEYVKVTEPLLMLECWQGIQAAKKTIDEIPFEVFIGSRTSVDNFFDVFTSMNKKTIQDRKLTESDLIVLACNNEAITDPAEQRRYMKAEGSLTCLAKIRSIKSANPESCDVTIRVYPTGAMMGALTPKMTLLGMKVMQMITVEREFSSLKGLEYYDLADSIIKAEPNKPVEMRDEEVDHMYKVYDVNKSQAKAIMGTYRTNGFSLIQGPPGTGKTKTILGIVGYSLSHDKDAKILDAPEKKPTPASEKSKILICAPSNAAVDELVLRLRDGVKNSKGQHMDLKVVRLGRSDAINAAVKDLTLEELVDKRLQSTQVDVRVDPNIREEHTKKIQERDQIRKRLNTESLSASEIEELETKLRQVNKERSDLAKKLDDQREKSSIAYRTREIDRRNIQAQILADAQVLCSTLSGSAHDLIANLSVKFDQVIIDEACQCLELSAIIPLRYGCKKCIMVGDPNQLPPTVLSQAAASYNYEQSLFVRMQQNHPDSVYLLNTQYRMHPMISKFPSAEFYNSKLINGPGMEQKNSRPWHSTNHLTPYRFFDIVGSRHEKNELTRSLFNTEEANICLQLVQKLMTMIPQATFAGRIGIISPYKEQIKKIKDVFIRRYGKNILGEIDFNTVDGYQGQEKEIIIMSCVRASSTGNIGFLSDIRRMNVALTRACTTLWILGNKTSLETNKVWKRLLKDAEDRNSVTEATSGFLNSYDTFNTQHKRASESTPVQPMKKTKYNGTESEGNDIPASSGTIPKTPTNVSSKSSNNNNLSIPKKPVNNNLAIPRKPLMNDYKSSTSGSNSTPIANSRFDKEGSPLISNKTTNISERKPTSSGTLPNRNTNSYTNNTNSAGPNNFNNNKPKPYVHNSTTASTGTKQYDNNNVKKYKSKPYIHNSTPPSQSNQPYKPPSTNTTERKPTSSGMVLPPKPKPKSSLFIPRKPFNQR
ncbi:SEN1 [Candida jiufengensis]|uniref:SEN1 n=1 Tax=Candida jiufengensis TaxID=497108 RepID=UPI002224521E|nr:SEN1 [Candida jiufengensis]KAI5952748.1 SEN1 [Candida jiufengensis]